MQNLVIVESPTKARTLQKFLGNKYEIVASMGHIRDLPKSEIGVDTEHNFEPKYVIPRDKRKTVNELKKLAQKADKLYLATDPDREGEAIAWHIATLLGKKPSEFERVVFHEITESAIKEAFENPRGLDLKLIDAQQARRILDRLVGYKLSPLLWQKVKRGLSAGRVQSVALRLIVEREKEVLAFKAEEYWTIEVELEQLGKSGQVQFRANVVEFDGKKLVVRNAKQAAEHKTSLDGSLYQVSKIAKKEIRRFPYPPFTTSTLQQSAANRLGMSAKKIMMLAQSLYEHGYITYMRTDSVNLSQQSLDQVRAYIASSIGPNYLPTKPRIFKSKSKNAQEAHEAIRPTNVSVRSDDLRGVANFNKDHTRLYELIWKRFVACQMSEALVDQTSIDITASSQISVVSGQRVAEAQSAQNYLLRATGSVIKFDGWLKLFGKASEEEEGGGAEDESKQHLPKLSENENLGHGEVLPVQHFTEPPPRYTEASLIKKLEELGIGRPSTYAPILSTIQDRFYVERIERKFIPTPLGTTVTTFLLEYFSNIIDYSFTAEMEDELDEISRGERKWQPTMEAFYTPFAKQLVETGEKAQRVQMEVEMSDRTCPLCGKNLIVRFGKFGKFLACSGFPDCKHTEALEEKIDVKCPDDGGEVVVRRTRRGKTFYGCKNWPGCKFASWTKPKGVNSEQVTGDSNK